MKKYLIVMVCGVAVVLFGVFWSRTGSEKQGSIHQYIHRLEAELGKK